MDSLVAGNLTIQVTVVDGGVLQLDWRGKSNDRQPTKILRPFFTEVEKIAAADGKSVEMHFEHLDHFNSSTITALIQFIQSLRANNLKLVIVFSAALKWQKLSFEALRIFEKPDGLLTFQTV